jgi:hypothetical protein
MKLFGGEEYSKENHEKAKEEMDLDKKQYDKAGSLEHIEGEYARQAVYDILQKRAAESRKKLNNIYANGQEEAIALNKQYDELVAKAEEALDALDQFEIEKLGMQAESNE